MGWVLRSIVVKEGLHLSSEFSKSREKLVEIWVETCPGFSLPEEEVLG